jgi:moderate conductance mechanosensitive channel
MRGCFFALWLIVCVSRLMARADAQALPLVAPPASNGPFDSAQSGLYTTAAVDLDGVPLLRVAAPTTLRSGEIRAVDRATFVDAALQQLLTTDTRGVPLYDPSTLRVSWAYRGRNEVTIVASDAQYPTPVPIVSVTAADAKYQQSTLEDIAMSWQAILQRALVEALRKREPGVERQHLVEVARVAFGLAIEAALAIVVIRLLRRRIRGLTGELTHRAEVERSNLLHRLRLLSSAGAAIWWLIGLSWFLATAWALALFPQTTALSRSLSRGGTAIGIIWIGAGLLDKMGDLVIAWSANTWKIREYLSPKERDRILLRVPTAAQAISHFKTFVLFILAVFLTIGQLDLPVGSVVTIGGVIALAITLAAQNLLRDLLAGITVLCEDQYAVGDYVAINGYTGLVEQVTLRMVMIRDSAGRVVTISHGSVTVVSNFSRVWSRIDYQLSIAPEAAPKPAIDAIQASVEELAKEPKFQDLLMLPIEWIGVDAFTKDWTLIRASIRTAPLRQFALRREINSRVRTKLSEAGIPYGPPIDAQYIPLL